MPANRKPQANEQPTMVAITAAAADDKGKFEAIKNKNKLKRKNETQTNLTTHPHTTMEHANERTN